MFKLTVFYPFHSKESVLSWLIIKHRRIEERKNTNSIPTEFFNDLQLIPKQQCEGKMSHKKRPNIHLNISQFFSPSTESFKKLKQDRDIFLQLNEHKKYIGHHISFYMNSVYLPPPPTPIWRLKTSCTAFFTSPFKVLSHIMFYFLWRRIDD